MLKKKLNADERIGLTDEEVALAQRYLKKYKTKGAISDVEAMPLLELYLIGTNFVDIQRQYQQYSLSQILLTAAIKKWGLHRNKMMGSLRERVQAKVVKSVVDSFDFMTTMLQVAAAEHLHDMNNYLLDPKNNPKPSMRVRSLKDFKDVLDSLSKLMAVTNPDPKTGKIPPMMSAMEPMKQIAKKSSTVTPKQQSSNPSDAASLLAEIVDDEDDSYDE